MRDDSTQSDGRGRDHCRVHDAVRLRREGQQRLAARLRSRGHLRAPEHSGTAAAHPRRVCRTENGLRAVSDRCRTLLLVLERAIAAEDGRVVDAKQARVAELRGCFGPTEDRARQNFFAEIELGAISFRGNGECLALGIDVPEAGLFPVRCQLVLSGLPAPFVGGLLTTNTITSKALFGGDTDPAGYTQASMATIRLWKAR